MYPYLFEGTFGRVFFLRSYLWLLVSAAVVAYLLISGPGLRAYRSKTLQPAPTLDRRVIRGAALVAVLGLLLGARVMYVALYREQFAADPGRVLRFWEGGLVFHGGLGGALLGVFVFTRVRGASTLELLDMALPFVAVGYAVGRVGCFLNDCRGGLPTHLPWGVAYPGPWPTRFHPTQLYSSAAGILMFLALMPLYRRSRRAGSTTAAFLLCAGGYRFLLEFVRVHRPAGGGLSPYQWTSLVLLLAAVLILLRHFSHGDNSRVYARLPAHAHGFFPILAMVATLLLPIVPADLSAQQSAPVRLQWGVPDHQAMSGFAGLERSPQAEALSRNGDHLSVRWKTGRSYIVPIFASSEHTLQGIRYYGYGIPQHVELEWLDPWNCVWYPLAEIPGQLIHLEVFRSDEHQVLAIDFGPPTGAEFHPAMSRFIWFRVTPRQAGEFTIGIFGYPMQVGSPGERLDLHRSPSRRSDRADAVADPDAASNELRLHTEVMPTGNSR